MHGYYYIQDLKSLQKQEPPSLLSLAISWRKRNLLFLTLFHQSWY